ncbi:serine palmitoyltransferase component, partial [Coemansia biformis]
MGMGKHGTQVYSSGESAGVAAVKNGAASIDPFQAPANSASLLGREETANASADGDRPMENAAKVAKKAVELPHVKPHEITDIPLFIQATTYLSFMIIVTLAHIEDFFGKLFMPQKYVQLRVQNGYAPMVANFESLWIRHVYLRLKDCFSRPISGVAGGHLNLLERTTRDYNQSFQYTGRLHNVLNMASYNYLGFAQGEGPCADKVEAAILEDGVIQGSPVSEVGRTAMLVDTENMVARFVGAEAAIIVSMGYATNSLNLPALVRSGCLIISDELNHSSLVAGARLSGADIRVFRHNDTRDLEKKLRRSISQGQPRTHRPWKKILVVVEGLYSMEGEFCNLPKILELRRKYKFYLYVDEAHSIGALGKRGRGICDHF